MKNTMKNKTEEEMMKYVSEQIEKVSKYEWDSDDVPEECIEDDHTVDYFRYLLNTKETKLSTSDCWLAMLTVAYLNKKEFEKQYDA